ncbi:MAG: hypothetical protein QOJ21_219 [Solirubrobacteraceae bacterium]|jgi:hypothetical protein|nr:hypothetical protein [Solirubrobacteraceae bacterium]
MLTSSTVHTAVPSRISVSAVTAGPVLARVFGILGARAGLSLDRVSDLLLAADTIADADVHADGLASVEFVVSDGQVELLVGPLADGGAERLVDAPRVGGVAVLPRLADEVEITGTDGSRRVRIVFS